MRSTSESVSTGMIGATITPTGMPASCSRRIVRRRAAGEAVRGSSVRFSSFDSVVTLIITYTSPSAAIGASRSMSRSTIALFVMMESGCRYFASTSRMLRVTRYSRSIG